MQQVGREKSKLEQEVQSQRAKYKLLAQKYDEDVGNLDTQLRQVQSSLAQSASEMEHARAESTELTRQLEAANARNDAATIGTLKSSSLSLSLKRPYNSLLVVLVRRCALSLPLNNIYINVHTDCIICTCLHVIVQSSFIRILCCMI